MSTVIRGLPWLRGRWLALPAFAILLVAMGMNTQFLTPAEVATIDPPAFSAEEYSKEAFPKVVDLIKEQATDLTVLAPAVVANVAEAGKEFGQDLGSGSYAFPVKVAGTVSSVDGNFMVLTVAGLPPNSVVRIPVGPAISGNPVRDATGTITYGNFTDQTEYQSVANQFKLLIQSEVIAKLDPAELNGKTILVHGAYSSLGAPNSYIIQPVSIELTS